MSNSQIVARLRRRLLPLYASAFFLGFVLWYAIEKLFMTTIGFDDASIGVMVAVYSGVALLIETPSGILADRWSRKGVVIIAAVFLALSALIGGFSEGIATYFIASMCWGVFYALYSGTYESIIYDTLMEERGNSDEFEKYLGRAHIVDSLGLVASSLLGGVVAEWLGLREVYYLSIPFALFAIIALLMFREPKLHKAEEPVAIKKQVANTFRAVLGQRALLPVLVGLILIGLVVDWLFEFGQLWLIALAAPAILYGPANALLLGTAGVGGWLAGVLKLHKPVVMMVTLALVTLSMLGLIFARTIPVILAAQIIIGIGAVCISIVFTKFLHDSLPSKVRAGSASAVSTIMRIIMIPLALTFGYVSEEQSVFAGTWIMLGLLLIAVVFILQVIMSKHRLPAVDSGDQPSMETYQK